jgi:hypothetical protein
MIRSVRSDVYWRLAPVPVSTVPGNARFTTNVTIVFTFNDPGVYWYFYRPHPFMRATIAVDPNARAPEQQWVATGIGFAESHLR